MVDRAALGVGVYGSTTIALLSFIAEKDFTDHFFMSVPLAILTGALLFINIFASERFEKRYVSDQDNHSCCPYFWTMSFIIGVLMGLATCWIIQAFSWIMCVAVVLFAGIYGFSHTISHGANLNKQLLENAKPSDIKHKEIYVEWLKLEHDTNERAFRNLVSAITLLVTGTIGYFLYVGDFWSLGMQQTLVVAVWAIVGAWFGVLAPIQQNMYGLREKVRRLGSSD